MASPQPEHPPGSQSKGKEVEGDPASAQPAQGLSSHDNTSETTNPPAQDKSSSSTVSDVPNGQASTSNTLQEPSKPANASSPERSVSQDAVPSTSASKALSDSATSAKDNPEETERPKDGEKDRTSLNTTLTGNHLHTHTPSTRRRDEKASDGAHTASSSHDQPPKSPSKSKKKKAKKASVFTRLFHVFVPCIAHSTRYHDSGTEPVKPEEPVTEPAPTATAEEKPSEKVAQETATAVPPSQPNGSEQPETKEEPSQEQKSTPAPLEPIKIPESTDSVVLPPTPTRSLLPPEETEGVTSGAVVPPGSTGTPIDTHHHERTHARDSEDSDGSTSYTEEEDLDEASPMDDIEDEEERLILQGGAGIPIGPDGMPRPLLPPVAPKHAGRKCLVLDLDETLVHSSFKSIQQADYVVPVEIEYHWHNVYVIKRPGVDNFLKKMGEIYEIVVFTASLSKYADPVLDKLDINRVVSHRLFRESCYNHRGNYVKDLSQLGRPIQDTIIIDNSPASYIFHPNNAVPVSSWFTDPHDQELSDLCPFLADLATVDDVRGILDGGL